MQRPSSPLRPLPTDIIMELPRNRLWLLLYICAIIHTGWSQQQCTVQVDEAEKFAPFNEWIQLNCTYNCSKPSWESRLQKRNLQEGDGWVSIEVLANDWEKSMIMCIADDDVVQQSAVAVMAYALPTKVTIDLEEELKEGESYEVTCTVFGVAPLSKLQVSVMREGREIDMSTFHDDIRTGKQSLSETYYFEVNRRDNLQNYYCKATLDLGTIDNNTVQSEKILVKTFAQPDVPVISVAPDAKVEEGETITLTCHSNGLPEPEYSWDLPSNAGVTFSQDKSIVTITKVTSDHTGKYLCVAKNKHGRVRNEQHVEVIKKPGAQPSTPLISVLPGETVKEGTSLNLTCVSGGIPEPEYFWTVPSKDRVSFSVDKREIFITKATSAHNGTYICAAQNTHGRVQSNQLVIKVIGRSNDGCHRQPTAILLASALALLLALL